LHVEMIDQNRRNKVLAPIYDVVDEVKLDMYQNQLLSINATWLECTIEMCPCWIWIAHYLVIQFQLLFIVKNH